MTQEQKKTFREILKEVWKRYRKAEKSFKPPYMVAFNRLVYEATEGLRSHRLAAKYFKGMQIYAYLEYLFPEQFCYKSGTYQRSVLKQLEADAEVLERKSHNVNYWFKEYYDRDSNIAATLFYLSYPGQAQMYWAVSELIQVRKLGYDKPYDEMIRIAERRNPANRNPAVELIDIYGHLVKKP